MPAPSAGKQEPRAGPLCKGTAQHKWTIEPAPSQGSGSHTSVHSAPGSAPKLRTHLYLHKYVPSPTRGHLATRTRLHPQATPTPLGPQAHAQEPLHTQSTLAFPGQAVYYMAAKDYKGLFWPSLCPLTLPSCGAVSRRFDSRIRRTDMGSPPQWAALLNSC